MRPGRLVHGGRWMDWRSFPVQQHVQGEHAQHGVLEVRIVVHDDGHHADVRQQALGAPDHVGLGQPQLAGRVQAAIVHLVVVALGQELQFAIAPVMETKG